MKHLKLLLFVLLGVLYSCKKEYSEPFQEVPAQPVTFTVYSRTNVPKHITAELWSVKRNTANKSELVERIDTIITSLEFKQTLMQTVTPTFYCIANLKVEVLDGYDILSGGITSNNEGYKRGGSCATDKLELEDTYFKIYDQ